MPLFLTLRDSEGNGLATTILPPNGVPDGRFRKIIVSVGNSDPYAEHEDAIGAFSKHYRLMLDRETCYPYDRTHMEEALNPVRSDITA